MKAKFLSFAVAVAGCMAVLPAYASLKADGLTYTLTAFATPNPYVADFTLTISGINGSSDTEGGRYGVFAIALSDPSGFGEFTAPSGFELLPGGLGSGAGGGCNGHGNFVCFQNTQPITQSSLAADSALTYDFSLVVSSDFSAAAAEDYQDDFKISWDGGKSKNYGSSDFKSGYDHVSDQLMPTLGPTPHAAPEIDPAGGTAALTLLFGGLAVMRGRRRQS